MRVSVFAATLVASLLTTSIATAEDGEVILNANDGKSWVTGRIVAIDDSFVTLSTVYGEMKIIRDAVYCRGKDCPKQLAETPSFKLARDLQRTVID